MSAQTDPSRKLAIEVATRATDQERQALLQWATSLLALRGSNLSTFGKAKEALKLTLDRKVIWPAVKLTAGQVKRLTWDERGYKGRGALLGAVVGVLAFSGQGAGIAALGTAIGVPLWVVLGAGGAFAGALVEELKRRSNNSAPAKTTYRVIDADCEDK